jgi:hypothetical protein
MYHRRLWRIPLLMLAFVVLMETFDLQDCHVTPLEERGYLSSPPA